MRPRAVDNPALPLRPLALLGVLVVVAVLLAGLARGQDADARVVDRLPGLTVHLDDRYIDVDAVVAARDVLLELVACAPNTKEHEALVALRARARHLHLALTMLGLEPGRPSRWERVDNQPRGYDPTGDRVRISLLLREDDQWTEQPLTRFIRRADGEPLPGDVFVFGGSRFRETEDGRTVYEAEASGNVIALVSFGDETLSWPTAASDANDELEFYGNPETLPEAGQAVKLRLRPVAGSPDDAASESR